MPVLEKVLIPQYAVDSKCSGVRMTEFVNFTNLFPCVTFLVYGICLYRYKNRPPMGFDELASEADQVIQLSKDPNGEVEYMVK